MQEHIKWFRDSSPYIDAHRDKTFVIHLSGEVFASRNFGTIVSDIALLNALGVRVVLTHGARPQIDAALMAAGFETVMAGDIRITRPEEIDAVIGAIAINKAHLEAELSKGPTNTPVKGREITTVSGNYIKARPIGILDGIDHQNTGVVRKVNQLAITSALADHAVVIVSPVGHSPSGETFNIGSSAMARDVAKALGADKLIYLIEAEGIHDDRDALISEIDLSSSGPISEKLSAEQTQVLDHCMDACNNGVERAHMVSFATDGALIEELYTRDGCGTQVTGKSYEQVRAAKIDDVAGILKLIEPLEAKGVLVKRSRELLESEIDRFIVIERDGLLISCAALYTFDGCGELACLVTHPDYRKGNRGDRLLDKIERSAKAEGLSQLFVLTTQSADWFRERGFADTDVADLPAAKQDFYNYQRNSKVLSKAL